MCSQNNAYKKELTDFLCYSYFKIMPEDWFKELQAKKGCEYLKNYEYRDYCLMMVIMKAYDDATMQKAYTFLIGKEDTILKGKSDKARIMASELLFKELNTTESTLSFNAWHEKVCKSLVDEYKNVKLEKPLFTYGNAQKWLNMTLKYLWLLGMLPEWIEESDLHIPIDSYILQAIKDGEKIDNKNNISADGIKGSGQDYTYKEKAWSNLDYDEYVAFYKKYQGELESPLKWENEAWIKTAAKRKSKETDEKIKKFFEKSEN